MKCSILAQLLEYTQSSWLWAFLLCFKKKKNPTFFFSSLGVVQGIITGVRGLCNGLGPALYGFIFFLFHVELNELLPDNTSEIKTNQNPSDKVSSKFGVEFAV